MIRIPERTYRFQNLEQLYETAADLPEAERHEVYARHDDEDDWEKMGWRNSLWMNGYGAVGDVSASDDFYNVIQYGDILEAVGRAIEQYDGAIGVEGHVALSPSGHKMSATFDFGGDASIEPVQGDRIDLGLKARSGHSGFHGLKYDVGAERQICSNGMVAFVSDMSFEQTHGEPLNPALAQHAVDSVVEGTDEVEERLEQAREETFQDEYEATLVLMDHGLDRYFEEPVDTLRDALREEMPDDTGQPSLYDTYNAATRAITHDTDDDMPEYVRDQALEEAGQLLDYPGYGLPDADYLGEQAVDNRIEERVSAGDDVEDYWEDETGRLADLRESYN